MGPPVSPTHITPMWGTVAGDRIVSCVLYPWRVGPSWNCGQSPAVGVVVGLQAVSVSSATAAKEMSRRVIRFDGSRSDPGNRSPPGRSTPCVGCFDQYSV